MRAKVALPEPSPPGYGASRTGLQPGAAAIGFLLADSLREGLGPCQAADLNFLAGPPYGAAQYNVDLVDSWEAEGAFSQRGARALAGLSASRSRPNVRSWR